MNKLQLDLSVIMPCYNVRDYIYEALDSLVATDVDVREVIVVDDGSEDDTIARVLEFQSILPIRLIRQTNQGAGRARNRGVSESGGEYIYFFDSDDRVTENFLSELSDVIEKKNHPDVIAFSGRSFTHDHYETALKFDYQRHVNIEGIDGEKALKAMVYSNCFYAQPSLYVVKRSHWLALECRFPEGLHQDEDVIVPTFLMAKSVVVSRNVYFERRLRPNSTMTKPKSVHHLRGRERNIRISLAQLSGIASGNRELRKILRKRCEMFANAYMDLAQDLKSRPKLGLLMRAAFRRRNREFTKRVRNQFCQTLGGKQHAR